MINKMAWIQEKLCAKTCVEMDYKAEWDAYRFLLFQKMFAMLGYNQQMEPILTVKISPQEGAWYREEYDFITEGYYMNKVHWISICYQKASFALLEELIDKSYTHFLHQLTKKQQQQILEQA